MELHTRSTMFENADKQSKVTRFFLLLFEDYKFRKKKKLLMSKNQTLHSNVFRT